MYINDFYDFTTGTFFINPVYKEILKLDTMLTEPNIPHERVRLMDGWQVWYPSRECYIMDAIEHRSSYGKESDRLEIMGLLTPEEEEHDSVLGYLTAEEVFERIRKHYNGEWDEYIESLSTPVHEDTPPETPTNTPMTPEEFKQAMADAYHKYYENDDDEELVHSVMDDIMCILLKDLGYGEGIDIFEETPKGYA